MSEAGLRAVRGRSIGIVFQDPAAALNPSQRVGAQIAEAVRAHAPVGRRVAWQRAEALLTEVGLAEPARRARDYPHRLSGGQRQRVCIAIALACDPMLLIADECTTGLDPLLARQVMELIGSLRARRGMAVLFVTHDLAQVRRHADTVQVLYAGQSVERGRALAVLARPLHPYTAALRDAAPGLTVCALPGTAPEPETRGVACRFAPRCLGARAVCTVSAPAWSMGVKDGARCFFAGEIPATPSEAASHRAPAGLGAVLSLERVSVRYSFRLGRPGRVAVRGRQPGHRSGRVSGPRGAERVGQDLPRAGRVCRCCLMRAA